MAKRRFIVTQEFKAWQPTTRAFSDSYLSIRTDFQLFADPDTAEEYIVFYMDGLDYETERDTFMASTKLYASKESQEVRKEKADEGINLKETSTPSRLSDFGDATNIWQGRSPKAFVSHSTQDRVFVERFATDLRANGIEAWYSGWEIKPGDSIRAKIEQALMDCEFFIIVLSRNSINRPWVKTELDSATLRRIAGNVRKIIPVKIEECGELPPTLNSLCWEDFSGQSYDAAFKRVLGSIFEIDSKPRLGSPPTIALADSVRLEITAVSASPDSSVEQLKSVSRSVEFPISMDRLEAFAHELIDEGFDARCDLFNGQLGLLIGPRGLDPGRQRAGQSALYFPLWELNWEANRIKVAERRFDDIAVERPPGWSVHRPYQRSLEHTSHMTKRRATYGGFEITVEFNGTRWTYHVQDPQNPELYATGNTYVSSEEAELAAVNAARLLCAQDIRPLPKIPPDWFDIE